LLALNINIKAEIQYIIESIKYSKSKSVKSLISVLYLQLYQSVIYALSFSDNTHNQNR